MSRCLEVRQEREVKEVAKCLQKFRINVAGRNSILTLPGLMRWEIEDQVAVAHVRFLGRSGCRNPESEGQFGARAPASPRVWMYLDGENHTSHLRARRKMLAEDDGIN